MKTEKQQLENYYFILFVYWDFDGLGDFLVFFNVSSFNFQVICE